MRENSATRHLKEANRVLEAMQARGVTLQLQHTRGGSLWTLDGQKVANHVAELVVKSASIVAMKDGLFPDTPQQWRW